MSAGYLRKCVGKQRHATRALAEEHRKSMVRAGKWQMGSSNTYSCTQCGNYHAGRMGSRNRGNRGKR
jgi:rubrerythrin